MSQPQYVEVIRQASRPIEPQPTGVAPRLTLLAGIRAVLFDVYGTLLISGSGDVGAADPSNRGAALIDALASVGVRLTGNGDDAAVEFKRHIETRHAARRASGVDFPEVEIRDVWRDLIGSLRQQGEVDKSPANVDFARLAIQFEVRVNPVWPMPGMVDCLRELQQRGTVLGIISNAQFFTPLAIEATAGQSVDQLGFDPVLRYYSYERLRAKPGRWLYQQAAAELATRGISPPEALYVGNDMRNDVWPAAAVGFRTALFAGDRRSLRQRNDDVRPEGAAEPDAVITQLQQIPDLLTPTVV